MEKIGGEIEFALNAGGSGKAAVIVEYRQDIGLVGLVVAAHKRFEAVAAHVEVAAVAISLKESCRR